MKPRRIRYIFRKPNKGNFSVEKVYKTIFSELTRTAEKNMQFDQSTLSKNYDLMAFTKNFFGSLFSKTYVVHVTGGCNYMIMAFPFKTRVLTIHDLFHFNKMKGMKGRLYDYFYYHRPIKKSHKIVVVSENTKNEILQNFKVAASKIVVLENPLVIPEPSITHRERNFKEGEMIHVLQIGDKPLKNYARLIEATKDIPVFYNFIHAKGKTIEELIVNNDLEDRSTVFSGISDEELYALYDKSDVLFFASEAEGFGLPIIEAQAFGMPVITSNIPPMSDVGKGAIQVDPFNVEAIKDGFKKLFDQSIMQSLQQEAKPNVDQYRIANVSARYREFYESLG